MPANTERKLKNKSKAKAELVSMIDKKVKLKALGNDVRTMKDVAIDLINASGEKPHVIADGCFLCTSTIDNLKEGITKNPQNATIERIYKYFGYEMTLSRVHISSKNMNQPKI